MKYIQKIEKEIEFEAGDIIEWKDPSEGKILAVVRRAGKNQIHAVAYYDDRGRGNYKVPHFIIFDPINGLSKLRKVAESEWTER